MQRLVACPVLIGLIASLGISQAQDTGKTFKDTVYVTKRGAKQPDEINGSIIDESPGGIKIQIRMGKDVSVQSIPTIAIEGVRYDPGESSISPLEFRQPINLVDRARAEPKGKTRTKMLNDAQTKLKDLESRVRARNNVRRHVQFKLAEVAYLMAQDDPSQVDMAIRQLIDFRTANPAAWQLLSALKMLATLQEDTGRFDEARQSYEQLTELPDVPADIKLEAGILVGKLLLRSGKAADAQKRLQKLASSASSDSPQISFVRAYLVASQIAQDNLSGTDKELASLIAGNSDPRLRGLAYNLLGDFHLKKSQADEAFWNFLRVDVQYNEDPEQHARALYHLANLYDKVKQDPIRGQDCLNRLMDQRFDGTEYRKLAVKQGKIKVDGGK
jgi:tetratricopeptide (TPR) repeat protein